MAFGDVDVQPPGGSDSGGTKLFGLPLPVVLIAGGGMAILALVTMSKKSGGYDANMVPLSTAVQLGDIQERQLDILGQVGKGFNEASQERQAYAQGQLEALAATQTHLTDQLAAIEQSLNDQLSGLSGQIGQGDDTIIQQLTDQKTYLQQELASVQYRQDSYYNQLHGDINATYEQVLYGQELGARNTNSIMQQDARNTDYIAQLMARFNGSPANSSTVGAINGLDAWYAGWQQNFGQNGPDNPYDLTGDNIVDIRDFGIWRKVRAAIGLT